ncbi:MAG TPA: hypothetical protein VL860_05325 [Planctomycetota bacterium]|nr:hypothetical protein [Planctomycetota bacterium]
MRILAVGAKMSLASVMAVSMLALTGCGDRPLTTTQRVDASADDAVEGTGIGSHDIHVCADQWTGKILKLVYQKQWEEAPTVIMFPAENRTTQQIDSQIITTKLQNELLNSADGKLRFIVRDNLDEVMAERDRKRQGVVSSGSKKALKGYDYYIKLKLMSSTARRGADESNYVLMSCQLIDAESTELIWSGEYEFKKVGQRGVQYQ